MSGSSIQTMINSLRDNTAMLKRKTMFKISRRYTGKKFRKVRQQFREMTVGEREVFKKHLRHKRKMKKRKEIAALVVAVAVSGFIIFRLYRFFFDG